MLKTYRTYDSKVGFLKYEFYNKLLGGVTFYIYIYIYIYIYKQFWIEKKNVIVKGFFAMNISHWVKPC